jgi:hypothetical protein
MTGADTTWVRIWAAVKPTAGAAKANPTTSPQADLRKASHTAIEATISPAPSPHARGQPQSPTFALGQDRPDRLSQQ